jgi:hypothetical protein
MSAMLALTMGATVFAAGSTNPDNPTNTGSITIEKNLVVSNPDLASVDGPGLTMNYALATATPSASNGGTTITDDNNHTAVVKTGVAGGLALDQNSISWPIGTAVDASAAGEDNVKALTATVDPSAFTSAGIYRYELTETVDTDTSNTGAAGETRYIDVYITNGANGLECSGVVMHDGATANGKPSNKATFGNEEFETVNIVLNKSVTGNMGDKVNQFPFAGTVTDNARYFYAKKAEAPTAVAANQIAGAAAGSAVSTTLCDQESYYISGLSHEAAVAYTETNNTADTYQTSITGGTPSAASAVAANATKAMASTDVDDAGNVTFVNDLSDVSPTGVVMRYGAPLFILLAGLALVVVNRRNRKATDVQ